MLCKITGFPLVGMRGSRAERSVIVAGDGMQLVISVI